MPTASIRGATLAFSIRGEGSSFIWAHGLTSSRAFEEDVGLFDWRGLSSLASLIRYDARGHGESSATYDPVDYTWENLGLDMVGLSESLDLSQLVLGGASMGCATALYAAIGISARVRALVLATPPAAWKARVRQSEWFSSLADTVETGGRTALIARLREQSLPRLFAEGFSEYSDIHMRHIDRMDEKALPCIYRGSAGSNLPDPERIRALRAPTVILSWEGDEAHPVSTALALNGLIQGSELHVAGGTQEVRRWPVIVNRFLASRLRD
jgi:pimeloyl-ACP methyl ester carboxylesterase